MNLNAIRELRETGESFTLDDTSTFGERDLGKLIMLACDHVLELRTERDILRDKVNELEMKMYGGKRAPS